jgi:pimeloyl-ACP methyl ester carboxylesterase
MWPFAHNEQNVHNAVKVPIVFVPGVMGTKLTLHPMNWDPDSYGGLYFWDKWGRGTQADKLAACSYHQGDPTVVMDADKENGFESVAAGFYKAFLHKIKDHQFPQALTPVYAVGYDWRITIPKSAGYLASRLKAILEKEQAQRAILITHRMGGLVSRTMLKQFPDTQTSVSGVIHVVQPAVGAVVLYRRFFTGMRDDLDGSDTASSVLNSALGRDPANFAELLSVLPGPFELCPSGKYQRGNGWLYMEGDASLVPVAQDETIFDTYASPNSPPGVYNALLHHSDETREHLLGRVAEAKAFYDWLQTWKLAGKTKAIYSTGLATDVGIVFRKNNAPLPVRPDEGDGTVPQNSANVLFSDEAHDLTDQNVNDQNKHQFKISGVAHADAFNNATVVGGVLLLAQQAIQNAVADLAKSGKKD